MPRPAATRRRATRVPNTTVHPISYDRRGARESDIQRAIMAYLDRRTDVYCWRNNTGKAEIDGRHVRFGCPGSADILGVMRGGRLLCIEVKAADGEQSDAQRAWQRRIEALGGRYIVARSVADVELGLRQTSELEYSGGQ